MTTASTGLCDFQLSEDDLKECELQTVIRECKKILPGYFPILFQRVK